MEAAAGKRRHAHAVMPDDDIVATALEVCADEETAVDGGDASSGGVPRLVRLIKRARAHGPGRAAHGEGGVPSVQTSVVSGAASSSLLPGGAVGGSIPIGCEGTRTSDALRAAADAAEAAEAADDYSSEEDEESLSSVRRSVPLDRLTEASAPLASLSHTRTGAMAGRKHARMDDDTPALATIAPSAPRRSAVQEALRAVLPPLTARIAAADAEAASTRAELARVVAQNAILKRAVLILHRKGAATPSRSARAPPCDDCDALRVRVERLEHALERAQAQTAALRTMLANAERIADAADLRDDVAGF